jgi:hypothetical protein
LKADWRIGLISMLYRTAEIFERLVATFVLSATCVFPLCGCGGKDALTQDDAQLRAAMTILGQQYGTYLSEKGTPPPDEAALRSYLLSRLTAMSDYGVKSVDDLLRLGRDGQPFKLIYETKVPLPERPEYVWVAHEQVGVAGKRLACDSRGGVYELTDVEFSQQLAGK